MKNGIEELSYDSCDNWNDSLAFNWILELQKGDVMQLKVASGHFYCRPDVDIYGGCILNGKFIRPI